MAPQVMVDVELLLVTLYRAALGEDVLVSASADVDSVEHLPMVIVSPPVGRMITNGYVGGGWLYRFGVTILAAGHSAAVDLADAVYVATHGMEHQRAPGVGCVGTVEDDEVPHRTGKSELSATYTITQFTGSFSAVVQPDNA